MRKESIQRISRALLFFVIAILLFVSISYGLVGFSGTNFQQSAGFWEEPKNSLDVVYIGASPTFTSWVAPIAWKKYGIAGRTFANNGQPFVTTESFLRIARKKQPNAVYMIAINGVAGYIVEELHSTTDYFPCSVERMEMIHNLADDFELDWEEELELIFPLIRYHSKWSSMSNSSFHRVFEDYKGAYASDTFLNTFEDITDSRFATSQKAPLPDFVEEDLISLLDYCKSENVNVVFILSAQYRAETTVQWYNTIMDIISTYGFPLVNESADAEVIGLDDTTDFYNATHTNIHGALKITDYLSKYLLDHYDFPEKSSGGGTRAGMNPMISIRES